MAREPNDIFMREFFDHPGWEGVLGNFDTLIKDLETDILQGTAETFEFHKGRLLGAYDAISHLKLLIKSYTVKG